MSHARADSGAEVPRSRIDARIAGSIASTTGVPATASSCEESEPPSAVSSSSCAAVSTGVSIAGAVIGTTTVNGVTSPSSGTVTALRTSTESSPRVKVAASGYTPGSRSARASSSASMVRRAVCSAPESVAPNDVVPISSVCADESPASHDDSEVRLARASSERPRETSARSAASSVPLFTTNDTVRESPSSTIPFPAGAIA